MTDQPGISRLEPTQFKPSSQTSKLRFKLPPVWQILAILLVLAIALVVWFLIAATAVRIDSNADTFNVEFSGGIVIPSGPSFLIRPGLVTMHVEAEGYSAKTERIEIQAQESQLITVELRPLKGIVTITGEPAGTEVRQGEVVLGLTPLEVQLDAGPTVLHLSAERYQSGELTADITGRQIEQTLEYALRPNWGLVTIPTEPSAATISIDGIATNTLSPGPVEFLQGEREISVKLPGYQRWTDVLYVQAGEEVTLPTVSLKHIGGTLVVSTSPSSATISINDEFKGVSPIEVDLQPDRRFQIKATLFGYQEAIRNLVLESGSERRLHIDFKPLEGQLSILTQPPGASIYIDGELKGESDTILTLQAKPYDIRIEKTGYAGYNSELTLQPNYQQELRVRLLTHEEARLQALQNVRTTSEEQELILLAPATITMGSSRRQQGRRSNEVFRTVELSRLFYLSKYEVTNEQFRRFAGGHDSGEFENVALSKPQQPVVNVSWIEAAQYCNWLSQKEGFDPFYNIRPGDPVTYNENSLGYRMPTEAEWSWTSRHTETGEELLLYPWGFEFEPPPYHGNYADRAAQHVIGRTLFNYNDNHTVAAPVGTFDANYKGIHDLGGNVAEWIHNFYEIPPVNTTVSNLGPDTGEWHVIRGSSWKHGTITDLRLSFRDYGADGRQDVGFRLARFAE